MAAETTRYKGALDRITHAALSAMAWGYSWVPGLRRYLMSDQGWINFSIGFETENGSVAQTLIFENGRGRVEEGVRADATVRLILVDDDTLKDLVSLPPNEVLNLLLKNRMIMRGNIAYLELFNLMLSVLTHRRQIRQMAAQRRELAASAGEDLEGTDRPSARTARLAAPASDPGVHFLEDPYLAKYELTDFPRLARFVHTHFHRRPEVCIERPQLLTDWYRANGFETDREGRPWVPELRQAFAYKYLMENRRAIIHTDDLLAGTTTTKEIGVVLYPDGIATMFWGELLTASHRSLQPYDIDSKDVQELHHRIFPYWASRNFRQWVKDTYHEPVCQQLDERFAANFLWKTVALSHTILDYPKLLRLGASGIIREIKAELAADSACDQSKRDTLKAMILCWEGVIAYGRNLAAEAAREAETAADPKRRDELRRLAEICAQVPEFPARTLDEAINAIWIHWVAVHMENTNAGFSLGRMDQWLQPYFESDMAKLETAEERQRYLQYAIELVGCFYMRCTDHLPLIPDIGNYLFGGSSSDQAITLGGITPDGEDAVNDMTYIFLKVTEMLSIRDPNMNARYHPEVNSEIYLTRLCEVNYKTAATPSIHNDPVVMASLEEFGYPPEALRDWSATGCVEPTLSGRHIGHTNCMMFNMVAAFEMALYNGRHPLMRWELGPKTGDIELGAFPTFDDFFDAFATQIDFLAELSCNYNNMLGEAHSVLRPTPMISAMIEGCIASGRDLTKGGARFNSSGTACIGLADITDSLMAIKTFVYEEKAVTFPEMLQALRTNFADNPRLHALILSRGPRFGSGQEAPVVMANRVTAMVCDTFRRRVNFRGGPYTTGFWSMSNHAAFGTLTGALPSGRLAGKPFTPGLTPEANASKSLLDNIRDVAALKPQNMNNNIAFNVKVVPSARDSHEKTVESLAWYVGSYCKLGGMQMQLNVVSTATLRAAMANPDEYRNLMVRISGYNAYFVTLDRAMQLELIERAEYGV